MMSVPKQTSQLDLTANSGTFHTPVLEKWLEKALKSKMKETNPSIDLGVFGLKNPEDIKQFLLTPAGGTIKAEISAEIALQSAIENEQRLEQQEKAVSDHRLKALIFQWLITEKSDAAQQLRELIFEQNEKAIKQSGEVAKAAPSSTPGIKYLDSLELSVQQFDRTIALHEAKQKELDNKEMELNSELESLEHSEKQLINKHDLYESSILEFTQATDQYETLDIDDQIVAMEDQIQQQDEQISQLRALKNHGSEADDLEQKQLQMIQKAAKLHEGRDAFLTKKIDELKEKVQQKNVDVHLSLENNDEAKAQELMHEQYLLNLKIRCLEEVRTKHKERKVFVDEKGMPSSYKHADFILQHDQKIVEKNGKHYLLKAGTDLDDLDEEAQNDAQKKFEHEKHGLMSVKKAVHHAKSQEIDAHKQQIGAVKTKLVDNKAERLLVENQLNLLQASRANAMSSMNQSNVQMEAPSPTFSFSGKAKASASPQVVKAVSAYTSFRNTLFSLCKKRNFSAEELDKFADQIPDKTAKSAAKGYLKKYMDVSQIPRTAPIPFQTMVSLLQNMDRYMGNAYKKQFGLQSPLEMVEHPQPQPEPQEPSEAPTPFHPSPFNTKPM